MNILKSIARTVLFLTLELCCTNSEVANFPCCKTLKTVLDCTKCNLISLPMSIMDNTTTKLLLANNEITNLSDGNFENLTSLKKLTLTNNPLQDLNKETFRGLVSLEHLALGSTSKKKPPQLPADTFVTVSGIKTLHLFYAYPTELPLGLLTPLKHLDTLKMALTPDAVLRDEFHSLKKLKSLHIISLRSTHLHSITGKMFYAAPQIEELIITGAVKLVAPDTLNSFSKLSSLKLLCHEALSVSAVTEAIANMRGPTLTTLVLDGSDNLDFYYVTPELFSSSNFVNITHLSLKNTHMGGLDPKIFYKLPNLRYLSAGFNSLFPTEKFKSDYLTFQSIENMKVEVCDISYLYQRVLPNVFYRQYCKNSENTFRSPPSYIKPPKTLDMNKTFVPPGDFVKMYLPPSLLYIYANYLGWLAFQKQEKPLVFNDNNVLYVDASYSNMESFPLVKGFKKLQGADFSNNRLQSLDVDQLYYLPSLTHLNLRNNLLDNVDLTAFLDGGSQLRWLDIGYNNLKKLPSLLLVNLTSLEYASFSGNPLSSLSLDLHSNMKLTMLDLSHCALTNLSDAFCQEMENLKSNINHTLSLNISGNRFECSCATLYMIHWLLHTNVNITDKEEINCKYKNVSTTVYAINYADLSEKCGGKHNIFIISISTPLGAFVVMIVMLILVYQFRWHLRWNIYKVRRALRYALKETSDDMVAMIDQQYHAFVAYNHDEDSEWVIQELMPVVEDQWGLRLCIGERDFIPGKPIVENIADAIDNSRKTILVITPAFAASEWCEFEMQMAIVKGKRNIVIIYKEEVPCDKASKSLRALLRSTNYIEYNEDPAGLRLFWERLSNCLNNH